MAHACNEYLDKNWPLAVDLWKYFKLSPSPSNNNDKGGSLLPL